ncbi:MAG: hypothetical protein IPO64_16455 [Bacteroidetes bacterium]|nr:hypothetical protein [Bacteroidota bacterium]
MDVLISPIATFTSNFVLIFAIGFIFLLSYYMPSFLKKNGHKKWVIKTFELNKKADNLTDAETDDYYLFVSFKSLAFGLLSVYLGYGMAEGYFISKRIKENRLHFDYKLNYNSGEIVDICLIETNSQFCFYVEKGMKTVKIAPISSIKNLELNDIKLFKSTK